VGLIRSLLGSYYGIIQGQDPWSRSLVLATMIPEEKMRMALLVAYDSSIPMIFIKKRTSKSPKSNGYSHSRNDPSTKFWDFFTIPVEHTPDPQPIVYDGISLEGEFLAYVPFMLEFSYEIHWWSPDVSVNNQRWLVFSSTCVCLRRFFTFYHAKPPFGIIFLELSILCKSKSNGAKWSPERLGRYKDQTLNFEPC